MKNDLDIKIAHPDFLDRVIKGIVGMRFGHGDKRRSVEKGFARLKELLPPKTHTRIEQSYGEGGWVNKSEFP